MKKVIVMLIVIVLIVSCCLSASGAVAKEKPGKCHTTGTGELVCKDVKVIKATRTPKFHEPYPCWSGAWYLTDDGWVCMTGTATPKPTATAQPYP